MSIVKMKRLRLFGMLEDRDSLLEKLQLVGCVEISQHERGGDDEALAEQLRPGDGSPETHRAMSLAFSTAVSVLDKRAPQKKKGLFHPRPEITVEALFDPEVLARAKSAADHIIALDAEYDGITAAQTRLRSRRVSFEPWETYSQPLEIKGTATCSVQLGTLPKTAKLEEIVPLLSASAEASALLPVSEDKYTHYVCLITHRSASAAALEIMRSFGFVLASFDGASGTARENLARIDGEIKANEARAEEILQEIKTISPIRSDLAVCIDRCDQDAAREEAKQRLAATDRVFSLEGWFPADSADAVTGLLNQYEYCYYEITDPDTSPEKVKEVPIKLKNNRFTSPLMMVTEMYSLPSYDGVDPNPLIAPFFLLFCGIMYADLGYGLLLFLGSTLFLKKAKPKGGMKKMMSLIQIGGIFAAIVGYLSGGFFGNLLPTIFDNMGKAYPDLPRAFNLLFYPLFDPTNDMILVLIGSIGIGFVQLIAGMAIDMAMKIRDGDVLGGIIDTVPWWIFFAGLAVGALGKGWWFALGGAVLMVLTQGHRKEGGFFKKLIGGFGSLYNVTSFLSDALSYSRLMALMLAGSVIASIVNMLASMPGSTIAFVLILIVGHGFNMAINIVGTFVHAARLQYLEYFNKFYKDGGRPFEPLSINTNHVDITKEDN